MAKTAVRVIYNILFLVFFVLSSPYYFRRMWRRGNWQKGFAQRFAYYDSKLKQAITNRNTIWMHAVSVGEVNLCTQLIAAIEQRLPNLKIVVSTTTSTGMELLQKKLPTHISKMYYPIDKRSWVRRALLTIAPKAVVLVEAEIWPNFLWRANDMRIPLFLVNARLSDRSYRGYKRAAFLFKPLFGSFKGIGAQNEADAARLRDLGCRPEVIRIVGSLKFDAAKLDEKRLLDVPEIFRQLGFPRNEDRLVLLGGSTHDGEEAVLAKLFLKLRAQFPKLVLVLVPRHFERGQDVGKDLSSLGLRFAYRSEMNGQTQFKPDQLDCLLVNTTGELKYFYEHADVIFVGKSLTAHGGQNPIEPAALGRAVVFGPNMEHFEEISRAFLKKDGAMQVRTAEELENTLATLLADPSRRVELGRNALEVVHENLGAVERTVEMIVEEFKGTEIYIAPKKRV
jgi:3-deoxy-D-manno-octulosonic-acid transferase